MSRTKYKFWKNRIGLLLLLMLVLLMGCQKKEEVPKTSYQVYYVNYDYTGVMSTVYETESKDTDLVLTELLEQLSKASEKLQYHAPLEAGFVVTGYHLQDGQLLIDFDGAYHNQELVTEILNRAAIVRTLSQIPGVQFVSFLVDGHPLQDASGDVIGVMSAENFIDNAGNEISAYEKARLQLYFANKEGDKLVHVNRSKVYNSNISLERLIVDEIIAGPQKEDSGLTVDQEEYPVVNPQTKVVSVNIRDGICYVNLDNTFLNQTYNVLPEVTIYAITNSLVELSGVNKVQIMVNGETNISYREYANLSTVFERNLDLVE